MMNVAIKTKNRKGQNEMLGTVIILVIIIVATILVVSRIYPLLAQGKETVSLDEAKQMMTSLDSAIKELSFEAPGAKRTVTLKTTGGRFRVSGAENKIKYQIDTTSELITPGTRSKEGPLIITSGQNFRAYESDVDSDGTTDLVLESQYVLFAVKKVGSPSSPASINTSSIITLIKNIQENVNITPSNTSILINNNETSAYGTGYSELTHPGEYLQESGIKIFVNSTLYSYEALFTLTTSQDFIELEVRNIQKNE